MRVLLLLMTLLPLFGPRCQAAGRETVLFDFGRYGDGTVPGRRLVEDQNGNLYGLTLYTRVDKYNSLSGGGTVFELSPPKPGQPGWTRTVIHTFDPRTEGQFPSNLIMSGGKLYGVLGIVGSFGSVFELTPPAPGQTAWSIKGILPMIDYTYTPVETLTADASGALYSATLSYGPTACGAVVKETPPLPGQTAWTQSVLFVFPQGECQPLTAVRFDEAGALYGTTNGCCFGDPHQTDFGGVYKLQPPTTAGGAWQETVLYSFSAAYSSPSWFFPARDGSIYCDCETAFSSLGGIAKLQPPPGGGTPWNLVPVYAFIGGADGQGPAYLSGDAETGFYGTAMQTTGNQQRSLLFKLLPPASGSTAWTEKVLFVSRGRGFYLYAPMLRAPGHVFYGVDGQGGSLHGGFAFEIEY